MNSVASRTKTRHFSVDFAIFTFILLTTTNCSITEPTSFRALQKTALFPANESLQTVTVTNNADILFVIDDSKSMLPAQNTLAASFPEFAKDYLSNPENKNKAAVITTSSYQAFGAFSSDGIPNPELAQPARILDTSQGDIDELIGQFIEDASVGINGTGKESVLLSLIAFLKFNEMNPSATHLFTPGRSPLIIMFSDENDQSPNLSLHEDALGSDMDVNIDDLVHYEALPVKYIGDSSPSTNQKCPVNYQDYVYFLDRCPDEETTPLLDVDTALNIIEAFFSHLNKGVSNAPEPIFLNFGLGEVADLKNLRKTGNYNAPSNLDDLEDKFYYYDAPRRLLQIPGLIDESISQTDYTSALGAAAENFNKAIEVWILNVEPLAGEPVLLTLLGCPEGNIQVGQTEFEVKGKNIVPSTTLKQKLPSCSQVQITYTPSTL